MNKTKTYYLNFFKFTCDELEKKGFGRSADTHRRILNSFNLLPENAFADKLKKDKEYWERACSYLIRMYCNEKTNAGTYITYNEVETKLEKKFQRELKKQAALARE